MRTAFSVLDLDHDAALPNGEVIDTVNLVSAGRGGPGYHRECSIPIVDNITITGQNGSNGFEAGNYDLSYIANNLVVNQRAVTLTALQQERIYGDPLSLDGTAFSVLDLDGDATLPNGEVIDTVDLVSAGRGGPRYHRYRWVPTWITSPSRVRTDRMGLGPAITT